MKWFVSTPSTWQTQTLRPIKGWPAGERPGGWRESAQLLGCGPLRPDRTLLPWSLCLHQDHNVTLTVALSLVLMTGRARPPQSPLELPWLLLASCPCAALESVCQAPRSSGMVAGPRAPADSWIPMRSMACLRFPTPSVCL